MTARPRLSLDGPWNFWTDPQAAFSPAALDPRQAVRVSVPAPWQSQSPDLRHYVGVGWYQRQVDLPAEWLRQRVILGFGAADYFAEVWLNQVPVGEHEGGYLPFELDVTEAARPGPNTLTVRVADPVEIFAEIPHGKQSWYGPLSGLWQPVWIECRPAQHLRRIHITPHTALDGVRVEASLSQPAGPLPRLAFEIFGPGGELCARHESDSAQASIPVSQPRLWDVDSPNLYTLRASLLDPAGAAVDELAESFGFRTIESRAGQILLNGRPIYLRGALDQDYYPELISTPPSLAYLEDSFRKAKAMGLNCLRIHIKVADPRYYLAADRVGLLIWTELPNWGRLTPESIRRGRDTVTGMLQRDWNHPAIIIWTIINEDWGTELYANPEHRAWLAEMYGWLKALDPTRLVVDNSPCFPSSHVATDINDFHFYSAMPDHFREWRKWVETFAGQPGWTFARDYEDSKAWRQFARSPWSGPPRPPSAEVRRLGSEPLVVSEFGNWGLPDVDRLRACYGGDEPWWFDTGLEWGDGVVYPHGIEQRFRAYHLDRVFPSLSALARASQRLQFAALKYEIEQMRRQPGIAGYVITEFTDVHWESNGLLDMCRNPKAFFESLGQINCDDMLVPDWERVSFWEGERCRVRLALSHYSSCDLAGSRLEWHLAEWPDVRGAFEVAAPKPAGVTRLKTVSFRVPPVERGTRARLELRLLTREGEPAAASHQELYFFPRRAGPDAGQVRVYAPELKSAVAGLGYRLADSLAEADLAAVRKMTDGLRRYLQQGGRVLWLAESRAGLQTYLGGLRVAEREGRAWQGDWVGSFSWFRPDVMFGEIPTGGLVDFAFADLTPEHVITGLSPLEFATHVYAGLFVGWLHRPAALVAERSIGQGRLLISTFRLARNVGKNPVASLMLGDMLAHLARPQPEPFTLAAPAR